MANLETKTKYEVGSWWPDASNGKQFAYRRTLLEGKNMGQRNYKVAAMAYGLADEAAANLSNRAPMDYSNLEKLMQKERDAEIKFVNEHGFTGLTNQADWTEVVKAINSIVNIRNVYEHNLERLRQFASGENNQGQIDITRFFQTYLAKAVRESKKDMLALTDNDLMELVSQALQLMFRSDRNNTAAAHEEEFKPYIEIANALEKYGINNPLVQDTLSIYGLDNLRADIAKYIQNRKEKGGKAKIYLKGQAQKAGNLMEAVESFAFKYMKQFNAEHTGNINQMKADEVIWETNIGITFDESMDRIGGVSREQNIRRMEEWFKKYNNIEGNIVFISDKNYDLGGELFRRGGFMAEESTLDNFKKTLEKINYANVDDVMFLLRNVGGSMLFNEGQIDLDAVNRALAYQIGAFVFDDVVITDAAKPSGLNMVHLFNFGNIYIPFSLLLQGLYDTLQDMESYGYTNFVQVSTRTPKEAAYETKERPLIEEDWIDYANLRNKYVRVAVQFMKSFSTILSDSISKLI